MARPKKYTKSALKKACQCYFASISRTVTVTESVDSGRRDDKGHIIFTQIPVKNDMGEEIKKTEFLVPPTVGGLCDFLGISRQTWASYCETEEFLDTTTRVRGRLRAYLEQELLTRKDVKGVIFDLQNNYGYSDKREIELGTRAGAAITSAGMTIEEKQAMLEGLLNDIREAE